ncbi:MAG: glycosyltransferase family 2 protein [Barnesiella sp.]|nr:glycosyltransferase family 2 protein [Barnesiella sp.]
MTVSASIVIYRTDRDELAGCLECLVNDGIKDIWIVDNSPEASDIEGPEGTSLRYLHLPQNPGYGAAHNRAIRESIAQGFDAHLVVNSDITFPQGTIPGILQLLDADPRVGQVSPRIVGTDGAQQYSQRLLPTPLDVFGRRFLPSSLMRNRNRRYLLAGRDDNAVANIPYHQGSFMLFRNEALREIGGFDERFFMYPEDIDITRRVHRRYLTLYYPAVTVTHAHRASSYKSMRMMWIHCRNMIKYFNKWGWFIDRERRAVNRATLASMGLK